MDAPLEIFGLGALASFLRRKARHAPAPGTACANCGAALAGLYCHLCGQAADDHHRSILHLAWEGVEGLTHLDGRLAHTLPPLFFRPGALARDHFEGRRARHVPPFRLFLVSLLIFMFVLESLFHSGRRTVRVDHLAKPVVVESAGPHAHVSVSALGAKAATFTIHDDDPEAKAAIGSALHTAQTGRHSPFGIWLEDHLKRAIANQEYYQMVLFTWAHRLAILLLPILAGLLTLLYVRRSNFFVYDHLIVSMQFLSFVFLVSALAWLIPDPVRAYTVLIASVWAPVNLYMILRGAYGSGLLAAGVKTLFLWGATLLLFATLMTGLLTLALAQM